MLHRNSTIFRRDNLNLTFLWPSRHQSVRAERIWEEGNSQCVTLLKSIERPKDEKTARKLFLSLLNFHRSFKSLRMKQKHVKTMMRWGQLRWLSITQPNDKDTPWSSWERQPMKALNIKTEICSYTGNICQSLTKVWLSERKPMLPTLDPFTVCNYDRRTAENDGLKSYTKIDHQRWRLLQKQTDSEQKEATSQSRCDWSRQTIRRLCWAEKRSWFLHHLWTPVKTVAPLSETPAALILTLTTVWFSVYRLLTPLDEQR